jgi:NAD(P)-dependent dehydrogenase (short-subunit alcohol dehydrogenase family)
MWLTTPQSGFLSDTSRIVRRALERFQTAATQRGITPAEVEAEPASTTALGYLPPSSEIGGTVVYLASDLARPVTGQSIRVDCGQWLGFSGPVDPGQ